MVIKNNKEEIELKYPSKIEDRYVKEVDLKFDSTTPYNEIVQQILKHIGVGS